jgi:hypothetical protein
MESNNQLPVEAHGRAPQPSTYQHLIYELAEAYKQWKCHHLSTSLYVIESIAAVFCDDCGKQLTETQTEY